MSRRSPLDEILARDLRSPLYLTPEETDGHWRDLFPERAGFMPPPYPIFSTDEERILAYGYPVAVTEATRTLLKKLKDHVAALTAHQIRLIEGDREQRKDLSNGRSELLQLMTLEMENALLSDYGRGLSEIFVLVLSRDIAHAIAGVPAIVARENAALARTHREKIRVLVARSFAILLEEISKEAAGRLRTLTQTGPGRRSSLLPVMTTDLLPLALEEPPANPSMLASYVSVRYGLDGEGAMKQGAPALLRLAEVFQRQPELHGALLAATGPIDLSGERVWLEPRLWTVIRAMGLLERIGVPARLAELYTDLGKRLKRLEIITALRRHIADVAQTGDTLTVISRHPAFVISPSTRPMDFFRPGVIDSAVHRFGLVYDLTNFTQTLEEIRQRGHRAEEQALRFMYIFQQRLNDIRKRRRLTFEKFLGDGAFYSSRRAAQILAAACEIQQLYDALRKNGFPFSRGIRIAINFGTYQLLPMMTDESGQVSRFEFFGHGIVELLRLTTGKSTREIEEIAEHLIHSGYNPKLVDDFLAPLLEARSGAPEGDPRSFTVRIDRNGELINEGIVLTPAFVEELARELPAGRVVRAGALGLRWAVAALDSENRGSMLVGLRFVGVARLKGLRPLEIIEAMPWQGPLPQDAQPEQTGALLDLLRRLAAPETTEPAGDVTDIPPDLAVVTYIDQESRRHWLFGRYRDQDDVLLDAIEAPLRTSNLGKNEPIEAWLFRNRHELTQLYDGLRRDGHGVTVPLRSLRDKDGYLGAFLAAPHRAPE